MALPLRQEPRVGVMSKHKDLVNRGVRLIVTETPEGAPAAPSSERKLPPEAFAEAEPRAVGRSQGSADVEDFSAVYEEAGNELPLHCHGVDKVSARRQSKQRPSLGRGGP